MDAPGIRLDIGHGPCGNVRIHGGHDLHQKTVITTIWEEVMRQVDVLFSWRGQRRRKKPVHLDFVSQETPPERQGHG